MKSVLKSKNSLGKALGILSLVILMSGFVGISVSQADITMTATRVDSTDIISPSETLFYQDTTGSLNDIGPLDPGSYTMQIGFVVTANDGIFTSVGNTLDGGLYGVKITDALNNIVVTFTVGPGVNTSVGMPTTDAGGLFALENGTVGPSYAGNDGANFVKDYLDSLKLDPQPDWLRIDTDVVGPSTATLSQSMPELPAGLMMPLFGALALGMLWMRRRFALVS